MSRDDETLELKLARAARDEAEQYRKQAAADLEAVRYERGQIEHRLRTIEATERSIAQRERKLKELGEDALLGRERAADAKFAEAKALLANYNNTRHEAARALIAIDERDKRKAAAREQSAA